MKSHHMSPREAVQTHVDVRAKKSIAMHWGTFVFTDERIPPSHFVSLSSSFRFSFFVAIVFLYLSFLLYCPLLLTLSLFFCYVFL